MVKRLTIYLGNAQYCLRIYIAKPHGIITCNGYKLKNRQERYDWLEEELKTRDCTLHDLEQRISGSLYRSNTEEHQGERYSARLLDPPIGKLHSTLIVGEDRMEELNSALRDREKNPSSL